MLPEAVSCLRRGKPARKVGSAGSSLAQCWELTPRSCGPSVARKSARKVGSAGSGPAQDWRRAPRSCGRPWRGSPARKAGSAGSGPAQCWELTPRSWGRPWRGSPARKAGSAGPARRRGGCYVPDAATASSFTTLCAERPSPALAWRNVGRWVPEAVGRLWRGSPPAKRVPPAQAWRKVGRCLPEAVGPSVARKPACKGFRWLRPGAKLGAVSSKLWAVRGAEVPPAKRVPAGSSPAQDWRRAPKAVNCLRGRNLCRRRPYAGGKFRLAEDERRYRRTICGAGEAGRPVAGPFGGRCGLFDKKDSMAPFPDVACMPGRSRRVPMPES